MIIDLQSRVAQRLRSQWIKMRSQMPARTDGVREIGGSHNLRNRRGWRLSNWLVGWRRCRWSFKSKRVPALKNGACIGVNRRRILAIAFVEFEYVPGVGSIKRI